MRKSANETCPENTVPEVVGADVFTLSDNVGELEGCPDGEKLVKFDGGTVKFPLVGLVVPSTGCREGKTVGNGTGRVVGFFSVGLAVVKFVGDEVIERVGDSVGGAVAWFVGLVVSPTGASIELVGLNVVRRLPPVGETVRGGLWLPTVGDDVGVAFGSGVTPFPRLMIPTTPFPFPFP